MLVCAILAGGFLWIYMDAAKIRQKAPSFPKIPLQRPNAGVFPRLSSGAPGVCGSSFSAGKVFLAFPTQLEYNKLNYYLLT